MYFANREVSANGQNSILTVAKSAMSCAVKDCGCYRVNRGSAGFGTSCVSCGHQIAAHTGPVMLVCKTFACKERGDHASGFCAKCRGYEAVCASQCDNFDCFFSVTRGLRAATLALGENSRYLIFKKYWFVLFCFVSFACVGDDRSFISLPFIVSDIA